jgi:hypothetical protein
MCIVAVVVFVYVYVDLVKKTKKMYHTLNRIILNRIILMIGSN